ncbi:response regulator [Chitinophaga sp. Cy-1792]|uniref:response regulator n=1 Tax=Chitinophaga sp. Cy-1792 TaxID=2608339 RepID=UPI00142060A1|nr:response regulator [Chitinophaga sp. Cy-1792]NIG55145.1 response regulator [Chitinophaga sp. Cy-1792]
MRLYQNLKTLFHHIATAGVEDVNGQEGRLTRYINILACWTAMLVFILGGVFYYLVNSLYILIPLVLEGIGMLTVIGFNKAGRKDLANSGMFALHYISAAYWTTLLGNAIPVEVVGAFLIVFLICGFFLIYTDKRLRAFSIMAVVALLVMIHANDYFQIIHPIPIAPSSALIMRICTTAGMLFFIIFVMFVFVKEIDSLLGQLRLSNKANAAFLRETFHEIRTPLNSLFGAAQLLDMIHKKHSEDPYMQEISPEIKNVLASSLLAKEIIDNVLDFKRIEAGKFYEIKKEKANLRESITSCIQMNQYVANLRKLKISLDFQLETTEACYDDIVFKKILNNLLSNAVKFSSADSEILITAHHQDTHAAFCVRNQGILSQDKISTIFMPFESERNTFLEGTGIGLHLTKKLIERLDGKISVTCDGMYTTFAFTMPLENNPLFREQPLPPSASATTEINELEFEGLKVLIVDDNQMNQQIIEKFVCKTGAVAVITDNGQEGLDAAIAQKPDLIISDSHMPVMDGREMLNRIRQIPGYEDIPVIIVSGDAFSSGTTNDHEEMLKAGVLAYLKKPLSFRELHTVMQTHLPKKIYSSQD